MAVLENFRDKMPTGVPELKFPVLDPLMIGNINENIKEGIAQVDINIQNLQLFGLSGFSVPSLEADLQDLKISFKLKLPFLKATSNNYNLEGKIAGIFPLYGDGKATIQIDNLDIYLDGGLTVTTDGYLQLADNMAVSIDFSKVSIKLENILGGGSFGDVINALLSSVGKIIFDKFKPKIMNELKKQIIKSANNELGKHKLEDIIAGKIPIKKL
ncbi:uncharacterized protein LOC143253627 isoform X2 [Tachypleus tridentatus]